MSLDAKLDLYFNSLGNPKSGTSEDEGRIRETTKSMRDRMADWDRNGRLLILGCGDGVEIDYAKELGFKNIVAITRHDEEYNKEKYPEMFDFDMHDFPDDIEPFDYVYSKETLEHSFAPYILLCELNRVMKVGAKFCHLIAEGMEKQGEWYHVSCFPAWVWVDLFRMTDFATEKLLLADGETGYVGYKHQDKDLNKPLERYSLMTIYKNIPRENLTL